MGGDGRERGEEGKEGDDAASRSRWRHVCLAKEGQGANPSFLSHLHASLVTGGGPRTQVLPQESSIEGFWMLLYLVSLVQLKSKTLAIN